jgi:nicotinamidase-related amidase
MKKVLIIVDMQNDFLTGSLANPYAQAIIPNIKKKIEEYKEFGHKVYFTKDTHRSNYLETNEGKHLPVEHCIAGTNGWEICDELDDKACWHIHKKTFGFPHWDEWIDDDIESIEIVGTCTSICVVSNALILKATFREAEITVDASCCACVTPESHRHALEVMKLCHINVIGE